jgi:broad specificity phosphatase PhoE
MATIFLCRHGQASFFNKDYDQLSELGMRQAQLLGRRMTERPSMVVSGTMKRHQQTADECFKGFGTFYTPQHKHEWNEYDHQEILSKHRPDLSEFEKLSAYIGNQDNPLKALQQLLNNALHDWMNNKHVYKETWQQFKHRVNTGLNHIIAQLSREETAWVFTSGGAISMIVAHLMGAADHQFMSLQNILVNASITRIHIGARGPLLKTFNEYGHLEKEPDLITYR